jgi:hypothetical protein
MPFNRLLRSRSAAARRSARHGSPVASATVGSGVIGLLRRLRIVGTSAALLAVGVAGCGGGSPGGVAAVSQTGPALTVTHRSSGSAPRHRRVHRTAHRRPRSPARRSTAVPAASIASPDVVQPQPPPGSCRARGSGSFSLPDPRCTTGSIDPAVTQANIAQTICRSGYTETVRPSESVTGPEKEASLAAYGDRGSPSGYEYDHLVPLELGGARNDPRNLWPEPGGIPNPKDAIENALHAEVCEGRISLRAAQVAIARNWIHTGISVAVTTPPAPAPAPPATAPAPPSGGSSEGPGSASHAGDAAFCTSHSCIPSFPDGRGTIVHCADGEWSHSGGLRGVCSGHGGSH